MEVIHELPQEVASRNVKPLGKWSQKTTVSPCWGVGTQSPLAGRQPTKSADGTTWPWRSSSIHFSFTQEPSQDPLGRFARALSSTEVALFPFPFCREALGAIRVRIWMNGMAAEEFGTLSLWGQSSGAGDSGASGRRMKKRSGRPVSCHKSGSPFKSGRGGSVVCFTHDELATNPLVVCHNLVKIGQPSWLPQRVVGARADWM
jgi:hypothetical protein